jgi:hypothetical protein
MFQLETPGRKMRAWLVGLTLAKVLIFLALALFLHVKPFVGDNAIYYFIPIAQRIDTVGSFNDVYTRDFSSVPPAYPFLLAIAYRVAGSLALPMVVCLQFLADLFIAFALLKMGTRFGSHRVAVVAGTIWLLFPPAVVISTWISPETFYSACVIGGLLSIAVRDPDLASPKRMGLSGLMFGAATLLRGNTLFLPFIYALYWVRKRAYAAAAVFLLAFGIPLGIWTARNWVVLRDPIVVSSSFGAAFMQGSDDKLYQNKATEYTGLFLSAEAAGITKPAVETSSNINRWMFRIGIRNYRLRLQNQGVFAALGHVARKVGYMWFLTESGNRRSQAILLVCALSVVPLGLWELWLWLWSGDEARRIPAITIAFWIGIHLLVVPIARYTVPILPVIVLAACFRADTLLRGVRLPLKN